MTGVRVRIPNVKAEQTVIRRWMLIVVAVFPMVLMWSLTNPMFASPDETAHLVRAQGFASLDFSSPYVADGIPVAEVDCYRFAADVTADCMSLEWGPAGTEIEARMVDGYPPMLHTIASIPYLIFDGLFAAYAARAWVALVNTALLAWAVVLMMSRGRWSVAGLALAVTPMIVFTASTINPSGLAATGSSLLVAGVMAKSERRLSVSNFAPVVIGTVVVAGSRRDGVVWILLIAAMLVLASPMNWARVRERTIAAWIRHRAIVMAAGGVAIAIAATSVRGVAGFISRQNPGSGSLWNATRETTLYIQQIFGVFGWLDATMGQEAFLLALIVTGMVLMLGMQVASTRGRLAILVGVTAIIATPIVFGAVRYPYFQGRYLFPVWVATMMLAGAAIESGRQRRMLTGLRLWPLITIWAIVHLWSYLNNLKRYATGRNGTWRIFTEAAWNPPMFSNLVAVVLFILSMALTIGILARLATSDKVSVGSQD